MGECAGKAGPTVEVRGGKAIVLGGATETLREYEPAAMTPRFIHAP